MNSSPDKYVKRYLEALLEELDDARVETRANAEVDAREFLETEFAALRRERPELGEDEAFALVATKFGTPQAIAREYREREEPLEGVRALYRKLDRFSHAPGWKIECPSCGRRAELERAGPFAVRIGAASVGKRTLGWCSECRRLRFLRIGKD